MQKDKEEKKEDANNDKTTKTSLFGTRWRYMVKRHSTTECLPSEFVVTEKKPNPKKKFLVRIYCDDKEKTKPEKKSFWSEFVVTTKKKPNPKKKVSGPNLL